MEYWEYMQSFGRKSGKKYSYADRRTCVSRDTIHRPIKTFRKSYRSSKSVPHESTPLQAQRRVYICRQLIGIPMHDKLIRRIVTCDEKWVYYRNPDASKQWLGPRQPTEVIVKKSSVWKHCVSARILKVCFSGGLFQTIVQSMRFIILNKWNEFVKFWGGDT